MSNLIPGRKKGAFSPDDGFMELYRQGFNDRQIADKLHLTQSSIQGRRTRRGLPPNGKQWRGGRKKGV